MLIVYNFWGYIFILLLHGGFGNSRSINQAAAVRVDIKFIISRINAENNTIKFNLCIDKGLERCFWGSNRDLIFFDDNAEVPFQISINNMNTDLTLTIKLKHGEETVHFTPKTINLKRLNSKDLLDLNSETLDQSIKMLVTYECESYYYPPKQCTTFCIAIKDQYSCDNFGNKICNEGLHFNKEENKCLPNNCIKSGIHCQKGGVCITKGLTFECKCPENYTGKFCEYNNPCIPNPCQNGGQCLVDVMVGSFSCSCTSKFQGKRCDQKINSGCSCPPNTICNFPESDLPLCIPEASKSKVDPIKKNNIENHQNNSTNSKQSRNLGSKADQDWTNVSWITTIIVAIGCLMIIISIAVTACVFYRTRNLPSDNRSSMTKNSPSTQYTQCNSHLKEGTFQRSLSLDDNSAYVPVNSNILSNPHGLLRFGSNNGLSLSSNSYQENPIISFVNYPAYGEICKQDLLSGYLMVNRNCTENSNTTDTLSTGSIPPTLPPRPSIDNEIRTSPIQNVD